MVEVDIDGVVKLVPVPTEVPPVGTLNQLIVPFEAVAPKVTVPESQREAGAVAVISGTSLTVTNTGVLGEVHPLSVVSA